MFQYFFLFYWWILLYQCIAFYLFIGWWTVGLFTLFWLFWIMLLWTLTYKFLCEYMFTFLWGIYQIIVLCWITWGAAKLFSKVSVPFYIHIYMCVCVYVCVCVCIPTSSICVLQFLHLFANTCDSLSFWL